MYLPKEITYSVCQNPADNRANKDKTALCGMMADIISSSMQPSYLSEKLLSKKMDHIFEIKCYFFSWKKNLNTVKWHYAH